GGWVAGGVKVVIPPVASRVTTPVTGVTPGPANFTVVVLIVVGFIASLNVAVTVVVGHTPIAAFGGVTEITAGGGAEAHATGEVVKVHAKLLASALPDTS